MLLPQVKGAPVGVALVGVALPRVLPVLLQGCVNTTPSALIGTCKKQEFITKTCPPSEPKVTCTLAGNLLIQTIIDRFHCTSVPMDLLCGGIGREPSSLRAPLVTLSAHTCQCPVESPRDGEHTHWSSQTQRTQTCSYTHAPGMSPDLQQRASFELLDD